MRAALYENLAPDTVRCKLCAHACALKPGKAGLCGVRFCAPPENGGETAELRTMTGELVAACNVDPVEKKPLYHYRPGSRTFSFGTMGCNFDCAWCQNDTISRYPALTGKVRGSAATPEGLVDAALESGSLSIAFTYTEPTVFFELMRETAPTARERGLGTLMVSNGFQSPECLVELGPLIDAANIDLKSFREATYRRHCRARLQPVLDNLKRMKDMGWWLEITTLVIPGVNDDMAELEDIAAFIAGELGSGTPWHLSAFHPCRHMTDKPRTPLSTLEKAREKGLLRGLDYVYVGNVRSGAGRDTACPACGLPLVSREGYRGVMAAGFHGRCPGCGETVPGLWE